MTRARLILLAVVFFVSGPVFAQSTVTGDWDATITGPQGPNNVKVSFTQDGEKVAGRFKGQNGEFPLRGTVDGNQITVTWTVPEQGEPMDITMKGTVEGETINGIARLGNVGEGALSARRVSRNP